MMNDGIDTTKLRKLVDMMDRIRGLDPEMPAQTFLALLMVAASGEEGILQSDISQKLDSAASASRILASLSFERHGLVTVETVMENRRFRRVRLTSKGEKEVRRLLDCLR